MSSNNTNEIDLGHINRSIKQLFNSLGLFIFNCIQFVIKNIFIFIGLLVLGLVIGFFIDKNSNPTYKHEVIVIPNFDSSSYLYKEIKNMNFNDDTRILSVKLEPIIDVYQFISGGGNLKTAEFMSENNVNFIEYKPGNQSEKIYKHHVMTIITNQKDSLGRIVKGLLSNLNKEPYFLERQKVQQENTNKKIAENLISIKNINGFFEKLGTASVSGQKELNIEMYPEVNGLLLTKQNLVDSNEWLEKNKIEQEKVIYDVSINSNIEVKSISYKIITPIILVFVYILSIFTINLYRRYKVKA